MKISPPSKKQSVDADTPESPLAASKTLRALAERRPEIEPAIIWLQKNGGDPSGILDAVLAKLAQRGRHLPKDQRLLYAQKVVLGEFLMRWAVKHRNTTTKELAEDPETQKSEVRPFDMAMMLIGDASVFRRVTPRLARQKVVGKELGNADDFSCFVIQYSGVIAHRFLSNFDPHVFNAAAKAVRYMEVTAVSHYLHVGLAVSRDVPGFAQYMDRSKRMSARTKLAAKLAYFPAALTTDERRILRHRYHFEGSFTRRMKIKDVARLLAYPSAAVVSRKLYRTRQWIRNYSNRPAPEVPY
jgi:hypothetical protein